MRNIDLVKLKELAAYMAEIFTMNPVSAKILNEEWSKAFPDKLAIARQFTSLIDQLEAAQRDAQQLEAANISLDAESCKFRHRAEAAEAELKRRDEQKPVWWWMHRSDQSYHEGLLINDELDVTKPDNENQYWKKYPLYTAAPAAVLPPALNELAAYDNPEICLWKHDVPAFVRGANWMREQAIALGCQPPAATLPTDIVITAEVARVGGLILKGCEGEFMDDAARRVFNAMLAAATAPGGGDA